MRSEDVEEQSHTECRPDFLVPISREVFVLALEHRNEAHKLEVLEAVDFEPEDQLDDRHVDELHDC